MVSAFSEVFAAYSAGFFWMPYSPPYNGKPTQRAWRWKPKQAVLTLSGVGFAVLNRTLFTHSFWIALSLNCDVKDC